MRRNMDMQIGALTMSMAHSSVAEPSPGLRHLDPDTDFKVRRITSCINEAIHMAANEPSLGLYRIQEHVHRTAPQLAVKKKDMKANNKRIVETSYDLNLSMDVVDSMRTISNFTRIQEALKTAIQTKRKLNIQEEQERSRRELDQKNAKIANRSISCNEPAEGYICPICYFALSEQEELITHWQEEHNLEDCENDIFQEVEMPIDENNITITDITLEDDNDMAVIHSPKDRRGVSEGEDVVKGFLDSGCNYLERSETSASDASSGIEDSFDATSSSSEIVNVKYAEVIVHNSRQTPDVSDSCEVISDSSNQESNIGDLYVDNNTCNNGDNTCNNGGVLHGSITDDSNKIEHFTGDDLHHVDTFSDNLHGTAADNSNQTDSIEDVLHKSNTDDSNKVDDCIENIDASVSENSCLADNISEPSHEPIIGISDQTNVTEENLHESCTNDLNLPDNLDGELQSESLS